VVLEEKAGARVVVFDGVTRQALQGFGEGFCHCSDGGGQYAAQLAQDKAMKGRPTRGCSQVTG